MSEEALSRAEALIRSGPDFLATPWDELRAAFDLMGQITKPPDGTRLSAASANGVPVETGSVPGFRAERSLLYLPGGGYVIGSIASTANASRCRRRTGDGPEPSAFLA